MNANAERHPCFNHGAAGAYARIHLPVAPECNIQCNYCNRKCDCVNESRPGVTSAVLSPEEAVRYLGRVKEKAPHLAVAGIAGPGDPFANPALTLKTLELAHAVYPDLIFCLSTNGLNLYDHIDRLAELGVSHVTITLNTIDPEVGAKIYAWVRHKKRVLRGVDGAAALLGEQLRCIPKLKAAGMLVKINSILLPGINELHIAEVARRVKELGADVMNVIPVLITEGTAFETMAPPSSALTDAVRARVAEHITLMTHCRRCRADAVGLLGKDDPALHAELDRVVGERTWIVPGKPYVAVATHERLLINGHLGDAHELHVFEKKADGRFGCIDVRKMPDPGSGDNRWRAMAAALRDCSAIVVSDAGSRPEEILAEEGILLVRASGLIDGCLETIYSGGDLKRLEPAHARCCSGGGGARGGGTQCGGNGMGCCA
jgi:nitrogen fixation protein NifB